MAPRIHLLPRALLCIAALGAGFALACSRHRPSLTPSSQAPEYSGRWANEPVMDPQALPRANGEPASAAPPPCAPPPSASAATAPAAAEPP